MKDSLSTHVIAGVRGTVYAAERKTRVCIEVCCWRRRKVVRWGATDVFGNVYDVRVFSRAVAGGLLMGRVAAI